MIEIQGSKGALLDIDLVSDFVCPWCFLGKARLDKALAEFAMVHPAVRVRVNWLPFFLNRDTPAAGEPYRPFLERKFGGPNAVDAMLGRVSEAAAEDGLELAFDRITVRPNTLNAHRLMYRAQSRGYRQDQVGMLATGLFESHFQRGHDIGDHEVLADIAQGVGDKRDVVLDYLASDRDLVAVKRMADAVNKQGVSAVPFFILNRKLAVSGAQSVAALGAGLLQALDLVSH